MLQKCVRARLHLQISLLPLQVWRRLLLPALFGVPWGQPSNSSFCHRTPVVALPWPSVFMTKNQIRQLDEIHRNQTTLTNQLRRVYARSSPCARFFFFEALHASFFLRFGRSMLEL